MGEAVSRISGMPASESFAYVALRLEAGFPDRPEQRLSFEFHHRPLSPASRPWESTNNNSNSANGPSPTTPISWIHGNSRNSRASRGRGHDLFQFSFIFINLEMAGALLPLGLIATWHHAVAATRGGTMRSAKPFAFRLGSKPCSSCEDLCRLKAGMEVVLRTARNLYRAAVKSAANKLIWYAVHAHRTNQHSQTCGVSLAA